MNYQNKYIKYKNKYINFKSNFLVQNGGDATIVMMCKNIIRDKNMYNIYIVDLKLQYAKVDALKKRELLYDIKFLVCIMSIHHSSEEFDANLEINGIIIDLNKNRLFESDDSNTKIKYFLEDIYTDDLELFISEYDKFISTGKSRFFFQSNLVNMAITLDCFSRKCFDIFFKNNLENNISDADLIKIYDKFLECKESLINNLLEAYKFYDYKAIIILYKSYIIFYSLSIRNKLQRINMNITFDDELKLIENGIDTINNFIYLSFNFVKDHIYARFEMTKLMVSHIGHRKAHGEILNTIQTLWHDFGFHQLIEKKKNLDIKYLDINRKIIKLFYLNFYLIKIDNGVISLINKNCLLEIKNKSIEIYTLSLKLIHYVSHEQKQIFKLDSLIDWIHQYFYNSSSIEQLTRHIGLNKFRHLFVILEFILNKFVKSSSPSEYGITNIEPIKQKIEFILNKIDILEPIENNL